MENDDGFTKEQLYDDGAMYIIKNRNNKNDHEISII